MLYLGHLFYYFLPPISSTSLFMSTLSLNFNMPIGSWSIILLPIVRSYVKICKWQPVGNKYVILEHFILN